MTRDEQIAVVRKVSNKIAFFDNDAVIAGGAPRDWFLGKAARDVDVFLYMATNRSPEWNFKMLEQCLGEGPLENVGKEYPEIMQVVEDDAEEDNFAAILPDDPFVNIPARKKKEGRKTNLLIGVKQIEIDGVMFQFMLVKDPWEAVMNFPCSLSKFAVHISALIWLGGVDKYIIPRIEVDEAKALADGICYYEPGTKPEYIDKLKERYGFQFKEYPKERDDLYANAKELRYKITLNSIPLEGNV